MMKKKSFDQYESRRRDVELRNVQPQWKNSRIGDEAILQSGKERILKKRIVKIHRGTLARILKDIYYKRIFPDANTIFEACRMARGIYPDDKEFMAFEIV